MNTWLTNNVIHEYANRWHKLVINKFYYIHFTWISCHALGYCICSTRSQQGIIGVQISVLKLKQPESVDSIGIVIAWTLNNYIMIIQKKNLSKSYKPLWQSTIIFECFHDLQHTQCHKKALQSTKPESCQITKMFFFLISSVTLSWWLSHKTAAITLSSVPIAFSQLWSLTRQFKPVTEGLWLHLHHHFLHLHACMHAQKSLSNEK